MKWLLLDTNYLAYRAFHVHGELAYGGRGTGVVYGLFKDIIALQEELLSTRLVFCWDYGRGLRYEACPGYKAGRRAREQEMSEEELAARKDFHAQLDSLRTRHLERIGFRNVLFAEGYESDDIIASICRDLTAADQAVIVSADKDLYQCLAPNVSIYSPHKRRHYTYDDFLYDWGLDSTQWAKVKAIAGCGTDNVVGVPGVGEATAAKYLRGELNPKTKTYQKIEEAFAAGLPKRNLKIVQLPYPGTPCYTLQKDEISPEGWKAVADELGFRSLRDAAPVPARAMWGARGKGFGL